MKNLLFAISAACCVCVAGARVVDGNLALNVQDGDVQTFDEVSVCDAYGLTAEDAARIPVTAKIADADAELVEKYADAFSATVKNGKLGVCNARGGGFLFYLR